MRNYTGKSGHGRVRTGLFRIVAMLMCIAMVLSACSGSNGDNPATQGNDSLENSTDVNVTETDNNGQNNDSGSGNNAGAASSTDNYVRPPVIDDSYRNYYEICVYSFCDSDGDGYGDLNGVIQKLDYIADMGYTGIWFMPVHPSPSYHKYDVTDYYGIDPQYGTLDDMKNLIREAHARDIDIILDLVVNHTSSQHPWFEDACAQIRANGQPSGKYADWYNFRQGSANGYSVVSGTDWYYEARFYYGMPDLNLDNETVRSEIANIMEYWFDLGVDGFRLDACTSFYTGSVDKNVKFLNWLATTAHELKLDCFLVGEAWENADGVIRSYYNSGLDSFFIFTAATGEGSIVEKALSFSSQSCGTRFNSLLVTLQDIYDVGIRSMFLGNHDTARAASFLRRSMPTRIKMGAGILAMMPGALFTYYGEEIGMIGNGSDPEKRIAMLWDGLNSPGYCTKTPEGISVTADSYCFESVAAQEKDPDSILNYYKGAMRLRNDNPEIARGVVTPLNGTDGIEASEQLSVTRRSWNGSDIIVVLNLNSSANETLKIDRSKVGNVRMTGKLTSGAIEDLGSTADIVADEDNGIYTMPPYSIIIFR